MPGLDVWDRRPAASQLVSSSSGSGPASPHASFIRSSYSLWLFCSPDLDVWDWMGVNNNTAVARLLVLEPSAVACLLGVIHMLSVANLLNA
mmetsp:Transcript_49426/g.118920  ORF Transcript_49426/g.118920 Transcript_49426/m.118920 type:complete len:91 (-) Transcript_49426:287-559(-)